MTAIGAGWYGREYESYGYDFPTHVTRIDQLDEALTIVKAMWSNERSSSFEGKYYRIKNAICNRKPIQKPHPIIMVGGCMYISSKPVCLVSNLLVP